MNNSEWRRALWFVGALVSLLAVIVQVVLTHNAGPAVPGDHTVPSYILDLAERVWRPTFLSFFTVCVMGLLYEVIMKNDDQSGLERLITASVRSAIYGRSEAIHVHATLTDQQNVVKEQLIECTKELHKRRLNQLERDLVLEIHEFGKIWELLISTTFETGETLCDFTIGSNAMLRFQAYQFSNYYSNLFMRRGSYRSSPSKVKILILCDYADSTIGAAERMAATSKELEGAVKRVLERIRSANRIDPALPPSEVYKRASNDANSSYEFRLVNLKHISDSEKIAFETPFNIYGSLALSQSFVTAVDSQENQPLPHLAVSFKAEDIDRIKRHFQSVWTRAFFSVPKFSETMTAWEDFGSGKLLQRWAEID